MLFALKYPERVAKLVLNGGNMRPGGVKLQVQIPVVLEWMAAGAISAFDKKAVAKREMLELMVSQPKLTDGDLCRLSMPVLVIAGKNDMIRQSHTERIHRAIPGSRLVILDGDHFVAHGTPDAFNGADLEFLKDA